MPSRKALPFVLALVVPLLLVDAAQAYFHPATGRFLNRDPVVELGAELLHFTAARRDFAIRAPFRIADEAHRYAYVGNDPIGKTDPLGLTEFIGCCPDEEKQLRAALQRAKQEIRNLKQAIDNAINADVGEYPPFTGLKLRKAKDYLCCANRALDSLRIKCECKNGLCDNAYAWVKWVFARTIHICPAFFDSVPSRYGREKFQACTLIHEATHKCGTNDVHYFWQNGEKPHDRGLGFFAWQDIASTYDTWCLEGFCVPGSTK